MLETIMLLQFIGGLALLGFLYTIRRRDEPEE